MADEAKACLPGCGQRQAVTFVHMPGCPNWPRCALCGKPMPEGETMFIYHGYSGPCPTGDANE